VRLAADGAVVMFCLFDPLLPPPLYSSDNRDGKSGQNGTCNGQANFTNGTLGKEQKQERGNYYSNTGGGVCLLFSQHLATQHTAVGALPCISTRNFLNKLELCY
jgi:hypothetical protein